MQVVVCINSLFFSLKVTYLVYILAMMGVPCCTQSFSSCGEHGLPFVVCGLLIAAASVVEHRV